jgi:arylsulfatase A-like enzyme
MSASLTSWLGNWPRLRRRIKWYQHVNRQTADEVNARAARWIEARGTRPYFAFVNYFDAHEFYLPPTPFAHLFGSDTARKNSNIGFSVPVAGFAYRKDKERMKPHEVQAELDAYEASIAYVDSRIDALLRTLAARGALANTIIVVTSDHGEHFGEHGQFEHGATLYPQLLHVPLVIIAPGRVPAGSRVHEIVTLRDLAATIEQLALGTTTLPGSPLARHWGTDSVNRPPSPILASRTVATDKVIPDSATHGAWAAIVDEKLVFEFAGGTPGAEVYDLRTDSLASTNVAGSREAQSAVDSARKLYGGLRWKSRESLARLLRR